MLPNHHEYKLLVTDLAFIDARKEYHETYRIHRNSLYLKAVNMALNQFYSDAKKDERFSLDNMSDVTQDVFLSAIGEYMLENSPETKKEKLSHLFRSMILYIFDEAYKKVNQDICRESKDCYLS